MRLASMCDYCIIGSLITSSLSLPPLPPPRYFFKKACDEFDSGVVHEEISEDSDYLPLWEGKVIAKVERIE